jgi:rhodanese-related sulfurtransferase
MRSLRRKGLFILLFLSFFLLTAREGFSYQAVQKITVDQLNAMLTNPDVAIIDVRTGIDWNSSEWKIKGAVREDPFDTDTWAKKYPKDKTIVVYCA